MTVMAFLGRDPSIVATVCAAPAMAKSSLVGRRPS